MRKLLARPEEGPRKASSGQQRPPEPTALEICRVRIKELVGKLVDLLVG